MSGTLTRNTDPHQKWSSRNPPMMGPTASPVAPKTTKVPMAFERSSGGYILAMIARAGAVNPAAPIPMTARDAMRTPTFGLNAATADPTPNSTKLARKTSLRPWRSASAPPSTRNPAITML
jgi:hypothetical protein